MIKNIIIIEDEKLNADRLVRFLKMIRPTALIDAIIDSVEDATEWFIKNPAPDLVFMDIRLSDGLSFEILDNVTINAPLIFITAYDEYALKAFRNNGTDYLLKPVDKIELEKAIKKAENLLPSNHQDLIENLKELLGYKQYRSRFLLPVKDGFRSIIISDILYFYSEFKMSKVKLKDGSIETFTQTLEELEKQIDPKMFFRANRQFIINIDSIHHIHNYFNGKLKVEIDRALKMEIIISREKAQLFKNWMGL
ncbi:LytTR family DNA-binding domain-containing protein [Chryseobacterium sp. BIGb0232]|uniref:LytR/AlgR family response regulator transcription factor n=1 Tax=Chryseobacterium sp. BIGb0232 TaxID=2940598 RepID=UPI000F472835|nr:LytTR family DNA-binding domain-containing protein [Chryseobacterium sp. BIGb0232]MCS4301557.1 DNA-binding LytR/AlgR family response regulator [Chryseobacterium sp. BIGb0232]ROS19588.1 LytTR family two component transcriptional regulator [Chryseobacterium nakagawai]